jgi:hypothetical protein
MRVVFRGALLLSSIRLTIYYQQMKAKYNAKLELEKANKKYGTMYVLPNGNRKLIKDQDLSAFLKANNYQLHEPSYQGSSIQEEQVGIKHS